MSGAELLYAALVLSWGTYVDQHCKYTVKKPEYYQLVKRLEYIESEGTKFGLIIAASMHAHKLRNELTEEEINPCFHAEQKLPKFFRSMEVWPGGLWRR